MKLILFTLLFSIIYGEVPYKIFDQSKQKKHHYKKFLNRNKLSSWSKECGELHVFHKIILNI